jgi:hypothetical protein
MPDNFFAVKGNHFFKKTFYTTILSTNIAVTQYLADTLFEGDLGRIVWASNEKTFRKREEQVMARNPTIGTLDMPYCSFRLSQDGSEKAVQRPWFNQALNVEGIWVEELGRKVRMTPMQLRYEGVICVQHDTDLYWLQQLLIWDASNEKLLKPILETESDAGKKEEIKNIGVLNIVPHMNSRFSEDDWIKNNKIQAIDLDIQVDTYLLLDNRKGYWIAVKSALSFLNNIMPEALTATREKGDEADYPDLPFLLSNPEKISPDDMMAVLNRFVFS